ncbi:histidine phosphatase family protein [soil metagenome]
MRGLNLPQVLWLVRHGQSAGNVARDLAEAGGLALIDLATRDIDVPLSNLGVDQANALGSWFGQLTAEQQPTAILSSPYVRAVHTAQLIQDAAQLPARTKIIVDERLREKEFGILDRLTVLGISQKYPELFEQRSHVGKFYFRPPGGESWCDVILRLRNLFDTISREHAGERLLIVGHQVIVNCFRYLIEGMSEQQILDIDRAGDVPNCAVSSYELVADVEGKTQLLPKLINFVAPLQQAGAAVTAEPDVPVAAKA